MTELLAVAAITVLALISPGADFAMVVRNSYLYGRTTGVLAASSRRPGSRRASWSTSRTRCSASGCSSLPPPPCSPR